MNVRRYSLCILFFVVFFFAGCNQPFDPRAPYRDQLVVYAVLSNDRDQQYIRLHTTYDAPHFNPAEVTSDPQVLGASVSVSQSLGGTFQFHDTLLTRSDTSRYNDPLHTYVASLRPVYGTAYQLTIQTPGGLNASGSIRLPDKAYLSYSGLNTLQRPGDFEKGIISVYTTLSSLAGGYVVRMTLEYQVTDGADTIREAREVPASFHTRINLDGTVSPDVSQPIFPALRRVQSSAVTTSFDSFPYMNTITEIQKKYIGKPLKFRRAVFLVMQAEQNFFKYYSITNGFQDSVSIRLDQPLYTNISGGTGLFGGYTVDTLSYQYESTFFYNQ